MLADGLSLKHAVAVLWTGGKDSCLALYRCKELEHQIKALVTFIPGNSYEFKAHPREMMLQQAERLGLPFHFISIEEPSRESYVAGLNWIKSELKVTAVATGDIDQVDGHPNWIQECCKETGLEVLLPLWKESREDVIDELLKRKIKAKITWINHPAIPKNWLGCEIDRALLESMKNLSKAAGIDLAGENGEYHTMVVDSPGYSEYMA